tara:strand:- start:967 stop:1353 length:387 start_codon:yes stop_codon:yes gene_type:complete
MKWKIKILVATLAMAGCHHNLTETDVKECCSRLSLKDREMENFVRYCKVAVFLKRGSIKDAKVINTAAQAVNVCKFVFGVEKDHDLLSAFEDEYFYDWRRANQILPNNNLWWRHPPGCKPTEWNCEEF